ncbi:MAG: AsmA family protein [Halorhodospira sp.]
MVRLLKWLLASVAGLLVILIATVAIAIAVIDPNDYRDDIEAIAERELGRELTIEGEITWTFFPWLGLEIGRIRLADAEGFYEAPFIELDRIAASVRLWPLLRGELHTRVLEVDRAVIRLMRNEQGEENWADLVERLAAEQGGEADRDTQPEPETTDGDGEDAPAAVDTTALERAVIGGLRLREAAIYWEDRTTEQQIELNPVAVEIDTLRLDEPVGMRAEAVIDGEERVSLNGQARLALPGGEPQLTADWQLSPLDPKGLLQALDQQPPATADEAVLRHLSGSGTVTASAEQIELSSLTLKLDDSRIEGEASLIPATPQIEFTLALDAIDADRYLPPPAEAPGDGDRDETEQPDQGTSDTNEETPSFGDLRAIALDLPLEALRPLVLDGHIRIDELRIAGLRLQQLQAELAGADGELGAKSLQAQLYDGRYAGHAMLDARGEEPAFDLASSLEDVRFAPLLEDLTGRDWLHGNGSFRFAGNGGGPHLHALIEDFEGDGQLAVENGALLGLNLPHEIRKAAARLRREEPPQPPEDEERTDFSELTASFTLAEGVTRNDDLRVHSPLLQASGEGQADLLQEQIDYRITATLAEGLDTNQAPLLHRIAGSTVPLTVSGPLLAPKVGIDLAAALGVEELKRLEAAEEEIEAALKAEREELEQRLEEEKAELEGEREEAEQRLEAEKEARREELKREEERLKEELEQEAEEKRDEAEERLRKELDSFF